jgi:subtilisin family serine protease
MNRPIPSAILPTTLGLAIALAMLAPGAARADALLSPDLQARFATAPTHDVIVTFRDRSQMSRLATLTANLRLLKELPMAGARLTTAQVKAVAAWPGVESIYFNAPLKYYNYGAGEYTRGHVVQDTLGLRGKGITVAIIDSGIDGTHPDLAKNIVQNVKIVGDLDLVGASAYVENLPDTDTSSGHGSHVAGIVAGSGEASINDPRRSRYFAGIAPEASLVGISTGEGINILFALEGFDYALQNQQRYGIDVISNSWGTSTSVYDPNSPVNKASYEAYRRGMVVAFAAGNDGPDDDTINPYALVPWVIDVASGTKTGDLSDFSSRGIPGDFYKHVDIVAPGSSILSTKALGTPLPYTGPVLDATDPSYSVYYAALSGTSMATPFIAGTAALLLQANPDLSPDQIELILTKTAHPMAVPGYGYHAIGAGYVDVLDAVDLASKTTGTRAGFLQGVTAWSSQGKWVALADGDALASYDGSWSRVAAAGATDGGYRKASVSKKSAPRVRFAFQGKSFQIQYPRDAKGGLADVYVDGVNRGQVNFYAATAGYTGRFPFTAETSALHVVELRGVKGDVYFDGALVDGRLFATNTTLVDESQQFTGLMGPSANNLEVDSYPITVGSDTTTIKASLGWTGGVDIDFALLDPDGVEVASGASLGNPEVLEYAPTRPGTYTYQVRGYAAVIANYTLTSTQTRATTTAAQ